METTFECRIVASEDRLGYYSRRVVTGENIYEFTINLATAMIHINQEVASYAKMQEKEEMENQGELPF